MNKQTIIKNIKADKNLLTKVNNNYVTKEDFINDCKRYVKAIKEGRMICNIASVSSSGMSRTIKFVECSKIVTSKTPSYSYSSFYSLFNTLGYRKARNHNGYFSISGCGMDMIFNTNYNNIHDICRLGIISKEQCRDLAQRTPTVI